MDSLPSSGHEQASSRLEYALSWVWSGFFAASIAGYLRIPQDDAALYAMAAGLGGFSVHFWRSFHPAFERFYPSYRQP